MTTQKKLTRAEIIAAIRAGNKSVMTRNRWGGYRDLSLMRAAKMDDVPHQCHETSHELIVILQ